MTEILSPVRELPLISPRTASYVAALIREGDKFDYSKWLREVREKERGAKQIPAAPTLDEVVRRELANRSDMPERGNVSPAMGPVRRAPLPIVIWRSRRKVGGKTPEDRLRRWLEKVQAAWHDFQANRARDAVYDYLEAVFAIVMHYKVRRRTKRLLRHAFKFANLPFDKNRKSIYCRHSLHVWRRRRQQDDQQMGTRLVLCGQAQAGGETAEGIHEGRGRCQ